VKKVTVREFDLSRDAHHQANHQANNRP
jgi:hypothetical protein